MNINDLTIGEAKELACLFGKKESPDTCCHPMIGKICIVRTFSAGVHVGEVAAVDNKAGGQGSDVYLKNARRIWKWEGAFTLSEVATKGIKSSSRVALEIPEIYLTGVNEFIPTTKEARKTYEVCNEK